MQNKFLTICPIVGVVIFIGIGLFLSLSFWWTMALHFGIVVFVSIFITEITSKCGSCGSYGAAEMRCNCYEWNKNNGWIRKS